MFVGSKPLDLKKKIYYCEVWKWLGPGGPPGLQIQWRAEDVRGGFDSHALPPGWFESLKRRIRMFGIGMPELVVILVIVLIIFGAGKLPQIGEGIGKGIRNFRKATTKDQEEIDVTPKKNEEIPEKK